MNKFEDDTVKKHRKKLLSRVSKTPNWDNYFSATVSLHNKTMHGFNREYFDKPHNTNYNFESLKYDRTSPNIPNDESDFYKK